MTTDTLLVQRAACGDREAFDAVYDASFPAVYAYAARKAVGKRGAELLCERILEEAFRELDRYEGDTPFAAWLLGVARRVARERSRERPPARIAPGAPLAS
jgi:DNA-directed RNA polymerase specialized sigma24 family protein